MKSLSTSLRAFAILFIALILTSCSKKSGSGNGGGAGNGTFSVTVDGRAVTGTSVFNNADVIITADPNAQFDSAGDVFLSMAAQGDTIGVHLPDRTGFTDVGASGLALSYGVITLPDTFYIFTGVQFNVTSLTKTRIIGTFSGTANTSLLPGGKSITLTNGTFNLPVIN
jgi:hypothetical protein